MELLDGIDLQTLVERFGPQPSERIAHFLAQACHSLSEAHEKDFVHRDVKPANIFTCRSAASFDFVKVLDFGLVLDRHPTAEELEDEKRFVGTPAVMAPEMVRFQAPVDARADIYALGCVGYWLLTGKRVFEAETRHDMLVMHAHQKPILPSKRVELPIHAGLEALDHEVPREESEPAPADRARAPRESARAPLRATLERGARAPLVEDTPREDRRGGRSRELGLAAEILRDARRGRRRWPRGSARSRRWPCGRCRSPRRRRAAAR